MYNFTVIMALVDYIPVILFGMAGWLILKNFYRKASVLSFTLISSGIVSVLSAGFFKATWKLLYAVNICNFEILNKGFLYMQSLGFILAGIGMIMMVSDKKNKVMAAAPAVYSGSMVFIMMMVVGLGMICASLGILAHRAKKDKAIIFFVLAFIISMGMGYAGRLDSTLAWVNWLEQSINIVGQACLLGGTLILFKK
ncbi:MAG: hypothetical protein Q4D13_06805 [Erysipelotrichaceae bacterium]|nr:hypothetical protein [Erysipelotrichaceae bacterium]